MSKLLLGRPLVESLSSEISAEVKKLPFEVRLVTVGFDNPQWRQYTRTVFKNGPDFGVTVENVVADGKTPREFCDTVHRISQRKDVCGVLLQQPLPPAYADAIEFLDPCKDVDCLTKTNVASLYLGKDCLPPATPLAVLKLLDFYGIDLQGKNVVIVGRGNAVGKPLALMALKRNATVTVCHTKTQGLQAITKNADIVVSACGVAGLLTPEYFTENSVVVDVGLSFSDGKMRGDVDERAYDVVQAVSPVPGGVGPVTRAALFGNLLQAAKNMYR